MRWDWLFNRLWFLPDAVYYWLLDRLTDNDGWRPLSYQRRRPLWRRLVALLAFAMWALRTWRRADWQAWQKLTDPQRRVVRAMKVPPSVLLRSSTYANAQTSLEEGFASVVEPHVRLVINQMNLEHNRSVIDSELQQNRLWQADIARRRAERDRRA